MSLTGNDDSDGGVTEEKGITGASRYDSYIPLQELLRDKKVVTKTETIDEDRQRTTEQAIKERETERLGQEKYYALRDKWSWFIFIFISFMLLSQLYLAMIIGFGIADFTQYKAFLHVIIAENFAQIVGMGYIVAKYLFPNDKTS